MSLRPLASSLVAVVLSFGSLMLGACGPTSNRSCSGSDIDIESDPNNCGSCGNVCSDGFACIDSRCLAGMCQPGKVEACYTGQEGTEDIGPCAGGMRTCEEGGIWSTCEGEVTPAAENCADGIDNNCNGEVDEDTDRDMDGFTTCAGDCCDSTECSKPELVNPGAFDAPGNMVDDDCSGVADDTALLCDQALNSNSTSAMDFAKAIDICQTATATDKKWGVIDGKITLADGTGVPDKEGYSIRPKFGAGALPQGGVSLAIISSGGAAAKGDVLPGYHDWVSYTHTGTNKSAYPADFYAANGNTIPNAPGCSPPTGTTANDPVMLTFRVRVPTNAKSFKLYTNFYSAEFPEWTCSSFNDFFVVLLDSTYAGTPANPTDKNLAFYTPAGSMTKVPVGVNLGHGNTGLFTQCVNGATGCNGMAGTISTCTGTNLLTGTGFDDPNSGSCDSGSLEGGATGWLETRGNVTPGEIITLRIAIWDTSDHSWDSLAIVDGFQWSTEVAQPGTDILIKK
ncbi:MAG: choice-of-anchor L domain-containing protein [Deltaproteobacteria bacterium]|nr:choice-of-anchor L domain-containing protein [Deltaproteobacteria bacterium]